MYSHVSLYACFIRGWVGFIFGLAVCRKPWRYKILLQMMMRTQKQSMDFEQQLQTLRAILMHKTLPSKINYIRLILAKLLAYTTISFPLTGSILSYSFPIHSGKDLSCVTVPVHLRPSSCKKYPAGHAQVYFGECSFIWGAGRHR